MSGYKMVFQIPDLLRIQWLKSGAVLELRMVAKSDKSSPRHMKVKFRRVGNEIEQLDPEDV